MPTSERWPTTVGIVILCLYGLKNAATALRNQMRLAPRARAGDQAARESVTQRPEASLFGVPNSAYGLAYYGILGTLAALRLLSGQPWRTLARLAAMAALLRTLTLAVALIRTRTWCPICATAHAINLLLAVLVFGRTRR